MSVTPSQWPSDTFFIASPLNVVDTIDTIDTIDIIDTIGRIRSKTALITTPIIITIAI